MRRLLLVPLGLLMFGCATRAESDLSPVDSYVRAQSSSRDLITRADIEERSTANALDVIRVMRPQWLVLRQEWSLSGPKDLVVYLNNARMGGRGSLQSISLVDVQTIQYFDPASASLRWGIGHENGAILIANTHFRL